jgi:hypothetical protein
MPFTFSHPAIVLPLTYLPKRWFSLTGLAIGSLTPDFEYFIRMTIKSNYSHSIVGLFWFDLPLGLLITFIFHNLVRNKLFDNLPQFLKSRFCVFKQFEWNNHFKSYWMVVICSILIGAASHLLWDSFTHEHGYFVQTIPALQSFVFLFGTKIPVLKILQHASTLIGAITIGLAIYKLPSNNVEKESTNLKYWPAIIGLSLMIIAAKFLTGLQFKEIGNIIATAISAGLISLMATSLLVKNE